MRQKKHCTSDYDDFYVASHAEAERQVLVVDEFIRLAEKYCVGEIEKSHKDV